MVFTERVGLASTLVLVLACSAELGPGSGSPMNGGTGGGSGATAGTASGGAAGAGAGTTGGSSGAGGTSGAAGSSGAGGTAGVPPTPDACRTNTTPAPGRTPLRRLTIPEYNNTVRDLLGDTTNPANNFPPPETAAGFLNNADAYTTTELHVEAYLTVAETLAASYRAAGRLALPCAADAQNCATQFITDFGKKAFRRPLTPAEVTSYLARFTAGSTGGTFEEGLEWVVGRMLQSPHFLYRLELENEGKPAGTISPLNDYSIATRLSYFLWSTMPDDALFAAADAGQLTTPEGVQAQVERMVTLPAFEATLNSFHAQWVGWEHVYGASKTATTTPPWDAQLQSDMIRESQLFAKSIYTSGGTFTDLLTSGKTFVNPRLAQFYGITYPGAGTDFVEVEMPNRFGLLTQPSIMAGHAHPTQSAPVKRGELIRKHLLCTEPQPPPMDFVIVVPPVVEGVTTRERFEQHRSDPTCFGCHVLLDPLGMPFENYDELGRWRDMDQGKPVDASGGLTMVPSLGNIEEPELVPVNGPQDFGQQLASLPEAQQCMVFNWFRYAMGHVEEEADTCMLTALFDRFGAAQNMRDLLVGIATDEGFRYRVETQPVQ